MPDIQPYNDTDVNINPETGRPVRTRGELHLFAGLTGGGKTTIIKNWLDILPLKKEIFDADGEYRKWVAPLNRYDEKGEDKIQVLAKDFQRRVAPLWERTMVFSEAGMFVRHRSIGFQVLEVAKSAKRRGNFVFMDFHSIAEIHKDLLSVFDYLYIKPHGLLSATDLRKFSKYPTVMRYLNEVQQSTNQYETRIVSRKDLQVKM